MTLRLNTTGESEIGSLRSPRMKGKSEVGSVRSGKGKDVRKYRHKAGLEGWETCERQPLGKTCG